MSLTYVSSSRLCEHTTRCIHALFVDAHTRANCACQCHTRPRIFFNIGLLSCRLVWCIWKRYWRWCISKSDLYRLWHHHLAVATITWLWSPSLGCGQHHLAVANITWLWPTSLGCGHHQLAVATINWLWPSSIGCGHHQLAVAIINWLWPSSIGCGRH